MDADLGAREQALARERKAAEARLDTAERKLRERRAAALAAIKQAGG
ncbi:MAG: hypothetical protein V4466_00180 [Pseudomonadota bacterium]